MSDPSHPHALPDSLPRAAPGSPEQSSQDPRAADRVVAPAAGQVQEVLPLLVDGVLLDMDGTLIDSGSSAERSWNRVLAEHGSDVRFGPDHHGLPGMHVLGKIFPDMPLDQRRAAFERIEALEIEDAGAITILPGTERLLAELDSISRALDRPCWTIVTSCTMPLFRARWARTGLPAPETVVTADQLERGKPFPEPYLLGAQRLGVDAGACLVLEDSIGGLEAARAAGSTAIAVTTTTPAGSLAPLAGALVTSLDDLETDAHDGRVRIARRGA